MCCLLVGWVISAQPKWICQIYPARSALSSTTGGQAHLHILNKSTPDVFTILDRVSKQSILSNKSQAFLDISQFFSFLNQFFFFSQHWTVLYYEICKFVRRRILENCGPSWCCNDDCNDDKVNDLHWLMGVEFSRKVANSRNDYILLTDFSSL
jgi:hypothetical protein